MAEFRDRELFLMKKAVAIAALVIEANDGPLQSFSDLADVRDMLDRFCHSHEETAHLLRAARIQITGKAD